MRDNRRACREEGIKKRDENLCRQRICGKSTAIQTLINQRHKSSRREDQRVLDANPGKLSSLSRDSALYLFVCLRSQNDISHLLLLKTRFAKISCQTFQKIADKEPLTCDATDISVKNYAKKKD